MKISNPLVCCTFAISLLRDEDADAVFGFKQAAGPKCRNGFANDRTADTEFQGQSLLGWQLVTDFDRPFRDPLSKSFLCAKCQRIFFERPQGVILFITLSANSCDHITSDRLPAFLRPFPGKKSENAPSRSRKPSDFNHSTTISRRLDKRSYLYHVVDRISTAPAENL